MSRIKANIAANIAGQVWQVALTVISAPLYIKILGIEAYGLIAFFLLIQGITQMLDFGLGITVNREIARLSGRDGDMERRSLSRVVGTFERWYWVLGVVLGVVLFFAIPAIAMWWLRPEHLSQMEIENAAKIFGLFAFLQWPMVFYQNGLMGMQRQLVLNAIQTPFNTVNILGGLVLIWFGPRTIMALLAWQASMMLIQVLVLRLYFWKHIGVPRSSARVDLTVLRELWRFSLGMSGISIAGLIVTYLDKVILSRYLPLAAFSYYSLAGTLAKGLYVLITPVYNAYFPRFSGLIAAGDKAGISQCYHSAAQLMATLSLPLTAVVAFFSSEIANLWLHNSKVAVEVAPIASLLVIGNCLNGLMSIPFALQLASGKTAISLYTNLFLVVFLGPAIIIATLSYGVIGAAATWVLTNGIYVAIGVPITHKYLLVGEAINWLRSDIIPPFLVSTLIVGLGRLLIPHSQTAILLLLMLSVLWVFATLCAAMSVGRIRRWGQMAAKKALTK
jgi:O-antigen/teichoic acid export membrane protein